MHLLILIIWLVVCFWPARNILAKLFDLPQAVINLLAVFFPIFILGPLANVFTAWFKLNDWTIVLALLLSVAGLWLADKFLLRDLPPALAVDGRQSREKGFFDFPIWLAGVFVILLAIGFYVIYRSATGSYLASPWEALPLAQVLAVAALTGIIAYTAYCRKIPTALALLMVIGLSLLIHSYLLVYQNGFGGDRFRHLGSEERIIQGLEYQPTLLTDNLWWQSFGPLKYPQVLTDSAKLSYGTMWSLEVIAAKATGTSVFEINRFLLPLLWSIFLTVIIFALAWLLRPERELALLAALLANSFYLLQYYGAQGLPASYGLLWLAFYCLFLVAYLKKPSRLIFLLLAVGLALMYFNYSLAFLLAGVGLFLVLIAVHYQLFAYPIAILAAGALVVFDYFSSPDIGFAWSKVLNSWSFGNLINFQALNRLLPWIGKFHLIDLLLIFGLLAILIINAYKLWRQRHSHWLWWNLMAKITLSAYFLSYWFLNGEHLVARRLTLFAILYLVLIVAEMAAKLIRDRRSWAVVTAVIVGLTSLTYYSGPVLNVNVGERELEKASAIWKDIKGKNDYCIQDDLNVILALEYVSAKGFQETINNLNCKR